MHLKIFMSLLFISLNASAYTRVRGTVASDERGRNTTAVVAFDMEVVGDSGTTDQQLRNCQQELAKHEAYWKLKQRYVYSKIECSEQYVRGTEGQLKEIRGSISVMGSPEK